MNIPIKNSINREHRSLSENDIFSKKSETFIKMSPLSKLQNSNSSPDLISETKIFTAIFIEDKMKFHDTLKNIEQKTHLVAVPSLPQQETTGNIKMKTSVLPASVKSSQEKIVKIHRKAPPPPVVKISPQRLTASSLPQKETRENNKMKTSVDSVSEKSSQATTKKVHRKSPSPPTVNITNIKETQAPKKHGCENSKNSSQII